MIMYQYLFAIHAQSINLFLKRAYIYPWKLHQYLHSEFVLCAAMKYKIICKYTFLLLCLAFVIDRTVQCFKKYFEKPQAMEVKIAYAGDGEILPHFTFCSDDRHNQSFFEDCGLDR